MGIYYFCSKTQIVGTRKNRIGEALQTSNHNLYFESKIEKYQTFSDDFFFQFLQLRKKSVEL